MSASEPDADPAEPVRFGFVGAGWITRQALAPAVHAADGAVLQAVAARDPERARGLYPLAVHPTYQELVDDPLVEVVYVALSNDGHLPWVLAALEAGKHVLCEKPMGLDPVAVRQMQDAARAADRLLVEAFWYRWHPRTRRLAELLAGGSLGRVLEVEAAFSFAGAPDGDPAVAYRLDPARGGGALYDVGCYALSLAHLALGPELAVLEATSRPGPTGVDLATEATLRSPDGGLARISCGIAVPDEQVVRVVAEHGTVEFGPPAFTAWHSPSVLTLTRGGEPVAEEFEPVDAYRLMVEALAATVRGRPGWLVDAGHSSSVAGSTAAIRAFRGTPTVSMPS